MRSSVPLRYYRTEKAIILFIRKKYRTHKFVSVVKKRSTFLVKISSADCPSEDVHNNARGVKRLAIIQPIKLAFSGRVCLFWTVMLQHTGFTGLLILAKTTD